MSFFTTASLTPDGVILIEPITHPIAKFLINTIVITAIAVVALRIVLGLVYILVLLCGDVLREPVPQPLEKRDYGRFFAAAFIIHCCTMFYICTFYFTQPEIAFVGFPWYLSGWRLIMLASRHQMLGLEMEDEVQPLDGEEKKP